MKKVLIVIFGLMFLFLAGLGLKVLLFPIHTLEQSMDTAHDVVDKTMTAENAIYNYEWFKDQEAHIRKCLKNEQIAEEEWNNFVNTLPQDRSKWSREDKEEENSLRNSYYALKKLTNQVMEDYNAKSSMVNRNIFKDNLPSNISRVWYSGKKLIK